MSPVEIIAAMEFVLIILLGLHCNSLSRRVDIVHKRITLELHANGLRSMWAELEVKEATI